MTAVLFLLAPAGVAALQHGGEGASGPSASGRVRSAALEADLPRDGPDVRVRIVYRLAVPPGVDRIPLSALSVDGTRIREMTARLGGGEPTAVPWPAGDGEPAGRATIPLEGSVPGDSTTMEISYRVMSERPSGASRTRTRLPVVQVAWPPEEARPGTFTARLALPEDHYVTGTFPTVLGEVESTEAGVRRYEMDVQVVPGLVSIGLREGEPPVLTFARALDLGVVLLLAVLAVWGFRALRRGAA